MQHTLDPTNQDIPFDEPPISIISESAERCHDAKAKLLHHQILKPSKISQIMPQNRKFFNSFNTSSIKKSLRQQNTVKDMRASTNKSKTISSLTLNTVHYAGFPKWAFFYSSLVEVTTFEILSNFYNYQNQILFETLKNKNDNSLTEHDRNDIKSTNLGITKVHHGVTTLIGVYRYRAKLKKELSSKHSNPKFKVDATIGPKIFLSSIPSLNKLSPIATLNQLQLMNLDKLMPTPDYPKFKFAKLNQALNLIKLSLLLNCSQDFTNLDFIFNLKHQSLKIKYHFPLFSLCVTAYDFYQKNT